MFIEAMNKLLDNGNYLELEQTIATYEPAETSKIHEFLKLRLQYLNNKGMFQDSLRFALQSIYSNELDIVTLQWVQFSYINTIAHLGDLNLAQNYLESMIDDIWLEENNNLRLKFEYLRLRLYILSMLGEFEEAKMITKQAYTFAQQLDNDRIYSQYYMQLARIFDYQGSLLPAIKNYKLAISYGKESKSVLDYLDPLHNLSNIYQYQGRYKLVIEGYEEEINKLSSMGFYFFVNITKGDLAWSYFLQGKDDLALNLLFEAHAYLKDFQSNENLLYHAEVITRIIIVSAYSNTDLDKDAIFNELVQINNQITSPRTEIYVMVSRATLFMMSKTFRNIAQALDIFERIIRTERVIDIEFKLYSYLSLVNILFQNYSYAGKEELLEEIQYWTEHLYNFADNQESPSIRLQADWIKAKILLAKGQRKPALSILTTVLKESDKLEFDHISNQVTSEIDHIDDDLVKSIDQTDFAYFRHDLTRQMLFSGQIQGREEPVLFFIMGSSGMTLYTRHFGNRGGINENLISSFVKAIEAFGLEAMDHSETLNQIQYQENKILIEPRGELSLVFVIRGETYPAKKKLLEFSKILDLPKYRDLFDSNTARMEIKAINKLNELFDSVFIY